MKKLLLLFILITGILFTSCGENKKDDENKTLIVGMELAYPPFETKDSNGNPIGISVDFAKEFGKFIGKDVKIENIAWDGLIPSIQTKKVDMVISSMTITEERKNIVDFSNPYANSLLGMLINKNSPIKDANDLNNSNITVAVKTGSTGFIYANKYLTNAKITSLADESACVTEVIQGKADVFLYDQLTIYRNWQKNQNTTKAVFIPFQNPEKWGVAFRKGDTELLNKMNEFIDKFNKEDGFDKLTEKYLSEEKENFDKLGFKWFFDLSE
ncbi:MULTISPECIES: transporter substrate-binding domain-containing protein [Fusobacterium]|uniref:transporter substrate-binding domain-containing protein n=1 Tax=Fusobacterium TaxID=848 RepID=UPI0014769A64|nr:MULTISPECIES: transporter substrate-binding domain-containing protein [Fusobacterium]NME36236.1 transporter substrate-binding domain-containing protein [Fusobacterium sp. FSA-380-WT-3A]